MGEIDLGAVLRENVLKLLERKDGPLPPRQTGITRIKSHGVSQGTAQRVIDGDTSIGLKTLAELARACGADAADMLTPGFASAEKGASGWPFTFEAERFAALLPNEQGMVEHAARVELERIEHLRAHREPGRPVGEAPRSALAPKLSRTHIQNVRQEQKATRSEGTDNPSPGKPAPKTSAHAAPRPKATLPKSS